MAAEAGPNTRHYKALSQREVALLWADTGSVSRGAGLLGLGLQECAGTSLLDQRGANIPGKRLERQVSRLELRGEHEGLRGRCGDLWRFLLFFFLFPLGATKGNRR